MATLKSVRLKTLIWESFFAGLLQSRDILKKTCICVEGTFFFVAAMANNLERQTIFYEEELIPNNVELVFHEEQLARNGGQMTVFSTLAEDQHRLQSRDTLFRLRQQLLFWWNRYIHRLWRYFED